jgi:hypothetical protein
MAADDEWFAARGFRIEVHETDYSGMVRIRALQPGEQEPERFSVDLVARHFTLPHYASGGSPEQARSRARERYLADRERHQPPGTLRWPAPVLHARVGDGAFVPEILLVNESSQPVRLTGGRGARGVLRHPDGNPVISRQEQPWPMAASMSIHQLAPGESVQIQVALSLMREEIAVLPAGLYSLTGVTWGELTAADVTVEITAGDPDAPEDGSVDNHAYESRGRVHGMSARDDFLGPETVVGVDGLRARGFQPIEGLTGAVWVAQLWPEDHRGWVSETRLAWLNDADSDGRLWLVRSPWPSLDLNDTMIVLWSWAERDNTHDMEELRRRVSEALAWNETTAIEWHRRSAR